MKLCLRNFLMLPIVLIVRMPIVLILLVFATLGEVSKNIYDKIEHKLPALERK